METFRKHKSVPFLKIESVNNKNEDQTNDENKTNKPKTHQLFVVSKQVKKILDIWKSNV